MPRLRRTIVHILLLALLALAGLLTYGFARANPEDLPWTRLDLARPIGAFTGRKLADLADEGGRCVQLLRQAGIGFERLPSRRDGAQCGYDHAVRFARGGAVQIGYRPANLGPNCAVAAGMALWEWHVVQPAALRRFGRRVRSIEHFGSYNCRRMYGRDSGDWSEHATANAIDIAGFVLEDGTRISVLRDWDAGERGRFLDDVRDGACDLFATVLSPDYNAAHRDHLHLDQASRGAFGWRSCR